MAAASLLLLGASLENSIPRRPSVVMDNARFLMLLLVIATELSTPNLTGFLDMLALMNPFQTRTLAFISGFVNKGPATKSGNSSWWHICMKSRNTVVQILIMSFVLEPICYTRAMGQWKSVTLPGYVSNVFKLLLFPGKNVHWYLYGLIWWRFLNFAILRALHWAHPALRLALPLMMSQAAKWSLPSFLAISESFMCLPLFVAGDLCRSNWIRIEEYLREELEEATPLHAIFGNRIFQVVWGSIIFFYFHLARCIFGGLITCPTNTDCIWSLGEIYKDPRDSWSTQVFAQLNGLAGDLMMLGQVVVFLLLICPRNEMSMTSHGRHTLTPFMLHHTCLPSVKWQIDWVMSKGYADGTFAWSLVFLYSWVLTMQFTQPLVRQVFDPIFRPFSRRTSTA